MFRHKGHKSIFPLFHPYSCTRGLKEAGEEGHLPVHPPTHIQSSCWGLISFLALTSLLIFFQCPPSLHPWSLSLFSLTCTSSTSIPQMCPVSPQPTPPSPPPSAHPLAEGGRREREQERERDDSPNVKLLAKRPCKIDFLHCSSPWHYFRGLLNRKPESLKME